MHVFCFCVGFFLCLANSFCNFEVMQNRKYNYYELTILISDSTMDNGENLPSSLELREIITSTQKLEYALSSNHEGYVHINIIKYMLIFLIFV